MQNLKTIKMAENYTLTQQPLRNNETICNCRKKPAKKTKKTKRYDRAKQTGLLLNYEYLHNSNNDEGKSYK